MAEREPKLYRNGVGHIKATMAGGFKMATVASMPRDFIAPYNKKEIRRHASDLGRAILSWQLGLAHAHLANKLGVCGSLHFGLALSRVLHTGLRPRDAPTVAAVSDAHTGGGRRL
jgi:hypothetical protein